MNDRTSFVRMIKAVRLVVVALLAPEDKRVSLVDYKITVAKSHLGHYFPPILYPEESFLRCVVYRKAMLADMPSLHPSSGTT